MFATEIRHHVLAPTGPVAKGRGEALHTALLTELRRGGQLDLDQPVVARRSARCAGETLGRSLADRRAAGWKHHFLGYGHGIPLVAILTAANRHDVTQLLPLVDAMPILPGAVGRPVRNLGRVYGCRDYD